MLANLIPTSVWMIVYYKSEPLLGTFALQLGAASCKAVRGCHRATSTWSRDQGTSLG